MKRYGKLLLLLLLCTTIQGAIAAVLHLPVGTGWQWSLYDAPFFFLIGFIYESRSS